MTILNRALIAMALLLGVAGVLIGVIGLQRADDATHKLAITRGQLADVRTQLTSVTGTTTAHDDQIDSIATLNSQLAALSNQVDALVKACPDKAVNAYYQRLVGAEEAGTDETVALAILSTICPNVSTE